MRDWKTILPGGLVVTAVLIWALASVSAHEPQPLSVKSWYQNRYTPGAIATLLKSRPQPKAAMRILAGQERQGDAFEARRLFARETFGGNGRTCLTCHSHANGTVSPEQARARFENNPDDPLFVHDGSDDEDGDGFGDGGAVTRMLADATILMRIPLHPNVTVKNDPSARFVTVRRGIPTTLNTPALDPVLMLDGRQPDLESQALGAITDHAQATTASFS